MLVIDQLSRSILQPVSIKVPDGKCIAIRGASGSGKSLLLRAIADLDPSDGEVTLDDTARSSMRPDAWRKLVTYVAAESGWWTDTVRDHFENPDTAAKCLSDIGLDNDAMDWPVSRLSTGERQRLSLLRAIVQEPRVLLLDEPTSALDPEATERIEKILHDKLKDGTSLIMVTHDKEQAERLADQRYVMDDGCLSAEDGE